MKPTVMLLHEYKGETNTDPLPLLKKEHCHQTSKKELAINKPHVHCPLTLLWLMKNTPKVTKKEKRKKKNAGHLVQNLYDLHGERQLFKPISLCFLDGPEAGIGILLGKNPKKWPEDWDLGFLKTLVVLEPWHWPIIKMNNKNRKMNRSRGFLHRLVMLRRIEAGGAVRRVKLEWTCFLRVLVDQRRWGQ